MCLLQQIMKTSLLIPYEHFYIQSQYYHWNKTQVKTTQCTWLVDLCPLHYVTTCIIHQSILQHYIIFLELVIKHTHLPTRLLILMVRTIFWYHFIPHSETMYCIACKTYNVFNMYSVQLAVKTQLIYYTVYTMYKTTCFGLYWPSSGFSCSLESEVSCRQIYHIDDEISFTFYKLLLWREY